MSLILFFSPLPDCQSDYLFDYVFILTYPIFTLGYDLVKLKVCAKNETQKQSVIRYPIIFCLCICLLRLKKEYATFVFASNNNGLISRLADAKIHSPPKCNLRQIIHKL